MTQICAWSPCEADFRHAYCHRCIIALRLKLVPGMKAREVEAHYTEIGRERALTEAESVVLESAVKMIVAAEQKTEKLRMRRLAA